MSLIDGREPNGVPAMATELLAAAGIPKLTLYTHHGCPWAHRVHITLVELGLPFEEVIIALDRPREEWYLREINPRGLVPSLKLQPVEGGPHHIVTESAMIVQLLLDLALTLPSGYSTVSARLHPPPASLSDILFRAKASSFVETFIARLTPFIYQLLGVHPAKISRYLGLRPACDDPTVTPADLAQKFIGMVKREFEPRLVDANPFYGGSKGITIVEIMTASFVFRLYAYMRAGMTPERLEVELMEDCPAFDKWGRTVLHSKALGAGIWDEECHLARTREALVRIK